MPYSSIATFLNNNRIVKTFNDYGNYVEIEAASGVTSKEILAAAIEQVNVRKFEVAEPSLNEIFIDIVRGG